MLTDDQKLLLGAAIRNIAGQEVPFVLLLPANDEQGTVEMMGNVEAEDIQRLLTKCQQVFSDLLEQETGIERIDPKRSDIENN